jgi:hypothetical protein
MFMKGYARFLFLDPQDEFGPSISSSVVLCFFVLLVYFLFYNKFIICLYIFRALRAHHQDVKIVSYSIRYHHNCRWPSGAQIEKILSQPVRIYNDDINLKIFCGCNHFSAYLFQFSIQEYP